MRTLVVAALLAVSAPGLAAAETLIGTMVTKSSPYPVAETLDRLEAVLVEKGMTIFTRIDHAAGADSVGQSLAPTEVLIFGNPKLGTSLMQIAPSMGLDLPLRAVAYQDGNGQVWLAYHHPNALLEMHQATGADDIAGQMVTALGALTDAALGIVADQD